MRKRRSRTTFLLLLAASAASALFMPALPSFQTASAAVFIPVSHPSHAIGSWAARQLDADPPLDAVSPAAPREVRAVYEENLVLRQQLILYAKRTQELINLNRDREKLGTALRPRCDPASVVGVITGDGEVLQVAGATEATQDMAVLHVAGSEAGIVGRVLSTAPAGQARVRLISDPDSRISAQFVRWDETAQQPVGFDTEPFIVSGVGNGLCEISRHRAEDLTSSGVAVGTWAVLADAEWSELLQGVRLAQVTEIVPVPDEAGFVRVLLDPSVNFAQLNEVMLLTRP